MKLGIILFYLFLKNCKSKPIDTVKNINLNYYTGKWLQTGTSLSTKLFGTGIDFKNVSAQYECINNCQQNNISVFNQGINSQNIPTSIRGYSYCKNNSIPGKRKLVFENIRFQGNYWVIKLGPIVDNKYDYAVISGPLTQFFGTRFSLYVLCRNVGDYKKNYEKDVKKWCFDNGYKFWWNKYRETN